MASFIDTVQVGDQSTLEINGAFYGTVEVVGPNSADAAPRPATSLKLDRPDSFKETIEGLQVGDSIDIAPGDLQSWIASANTADISHTKVSGGLLTITMSDGREGSLAVSGLSANAVFTVRRLPAANGGTGDYALTYQLANPKIDGGSTGGTPVKSESTGNSYLDSMIWGWNAWNPSKGPITYWFGTAADVPAAVSVHGQTVEVPLNDARLGTWTDEIRDGFMAALDAYAAVSTLTFARAASVADADLVWWLARGLGGSLGRSEVPATMPGGQIWTYFNDLPWTKDTTDLTKGPQQLLFGGDGNNTIVHEIGHSLGLAHPHDGGGEPNALPFPGIPSEKYPKDAENPGTNGQNQGIFSAMSYVDGWSGQGPNPPQSDRGAQGALGAFDIAALQLLYGANMAYRAGNDVYGLPDVAGPGTGWMSLWDADGVDAISNAGSAAPSTIDLRAATLVDPTDKAADPVLAANAGGYVSWVTGVQGGFTVANKAVIENAAGGSGADIIIGNYVNNVIDGGGGKDTITGGPGADIFVLKPGYGLPAITDYSPDRGGVGKSSAVAEIASGDGPAGTTPADTGDGDIINLSAFAATIPDFAALSGRASQAGKNVAIDLGNGDVLTLENFTLGDLDGRGFHFGPLPTVTKLAATSDSQSTVVRAGDVVTISLSASASLTVLGDATLKLNLDAVATYRDGSGTGTLTFSYTVRPGDSVADLKVTGLGPTDGALIWDHFGSTLSGPVVGDLGLQIDATPPVIAYGDAYIVLQGQTLNGATSVLANDEGASTASVLANAGRGTLQFATNGAFDYSPAAGFSGTDTFTYRAGDSGNSDDARALLYVVPVLTGAATTLDLLALTAEQQIASTYAAFFGRGADAAGFAFWLGEFDRHLPIQGAGALFANISSSFAISEEARALYPFLLNPFEASEGQISAFLDSVYKNLFDRSFDAGGLAYWTNQIKQVLGAGQFVGSVLINIMSGAQDSVDGKDITTLMGKVAVSLAYVREQQAHNTVWAGAADVAAATALLQDVNADPQAVLIGVRNAEILVTGHA